MTRKVRLTDYNQRIEVPQGAALFLEGGDIVVDGEIGSEGDSLGIVGGKPGYAPGGGGSGNATSLDGVPVAAASPTPGDFLVYVPEGVWANSAPPFNPTITSAQEGDVIARVGGVWVNKPGPLWTPADARSWGGGDGALPASWVVGDAATLAWDNPTGYLRLSASAADASVPLLRVPLPVQATYAVAFRVWAPMAYSHQGAWWMGFSSDDTLGTLDGVAYDAYGRLWRELLGASGNGVLGTFAAGYVWQPIWFSLFDDGTNVHWAASYDGVLWQEDDNEPHTATPTSFVVGLATANHAPADLAISNVQFGATALPGVWT